MRSSLLLLALALPGTALAVASPPQQEHVGSDASSSARPPAHHPLFEVRYVLLKAPLPPRENPIPRIDMGDGKASIHTLPLAGGSLLMSSSGFMAPNTLMCRSWACMDQPQR
jgi:hypothetical protein